jgi:hypothetical protein
MNAPGGVVFEGASETAQSLLVADDLGQALVRVDLRTGSRSVVTGSGEPLGFPTDVVFDAEQGTRGRALVVDALLPGVLRVDLATGERIAVSGPDVGSGPAFGMEDNISLTGIAFDPDAGRVLVTNEYAPRAVYSVDLVSGDRSIVTDETRGVGPRLELPNGIVLDDTAFPLAPRALVLGGSAILAVDLVTGDRTELSSFNVGSGDPIAYAVRGAIRRSDSTLLVVDSFRGSLHFVRLDNGDRSIVSGSDYQQTSIVGGGPEVDAASGLQADFERKVAYVADSTRGAILAVDLVSGDRVILSR